MESSWRSGVFGQEFYVVGDGNAGANLLAGESLVALMAAAAATIGAAGAGDPDVPTYEDICFRVPSGECFVESILGTCPLSLVGACIAAQGKPETDRRRRRPTPPPRTQACGSMTPRGSSRTATCWAP